MTLMLALLMALPGASETLVLKEKARTPGRYVRLVDLLDPASLGEAARARLEGVYLGRAAEEGKTRVITVDEIKKELERRSLDPEGFAFMGEKVEVGTGGEPVEGEALRRAVAFEIKRYAMERLSGVRPEEIVVRIAYLGGEEGLEGFGVTGLRPRDAGDFGKAEFTAELTDRSGREKREIEVIARILRLREVAFAARDIGIAKVLERADLDVKRVETAGDEGYAGDPAALLGSKAAARIRKGAAIMTIDVRLKPVVKARDVVRVKGENFEVDACALEGGAAGEEILMECLASKKRLRAKVLDAETVRMVRGER